MRHFRNILYVTRGIGNETDGLKQALSLARNNGAPLEILVVSPSLPDGMREYSQRYSSAILDETQEIIGRTAEALKIGEGEIELSYAQVGDTAPAVGVIRTVLEHRHDLVIKQAETSDGRGGLRAFDMDLLRKCPCPVWLCRPIAKPRSEISVAVAIDPHSEGEAALALSKRLLELARSLADDCSGMLRIVACWGYAHESYLRNNPWIRVPEKEIDEAIETERLASHRELQMLTNQAGIERHNSIIEHIDGQPEDVIPTYIADNGIDVLVMGTLARTGIAGFIIGNTAENIVQNVPCSLLTLKPAGFSTPVKLYAS